MATLAVNTATITVKTVNLTTKTLKQIPRLAYKDCAKLLTDAGNIVGWLDGSVVGDQRADTWLLLKTGEYEYGLYPAHFERRKKHPHIYIA